jgi:hypothetical protein
MCFRKVSTLRASGEDDGTANRTPSAWMISLASSSCPRANRVLRLGYSNRAQMGHSCRAPRWRFHSEFNADTAPEYDSEGIHLFAPRPSLSVKLDSAFVNYNARDWLQVQAGFLFIPTYWRTHRYESTTLTVDEPLIDQNVFPTALKAAKFGEHDGLVCRG